MRRMNRIPDHLSEEDRIVYRRWMRSLVLSYALAIIAAIAFTALDKRPVDIAGAYKADIARNGPSSTTTVASASPPPVNWP